MRVSKTLYIVTYKDFAKLAHLRILLLTKFMQMRFGPKDKKPTFNSLK